MILVDDPLWMWRGRRWCHLVSDVSHDELHAFAQRLGLPRHVFQGDHYDVPEDHRERAIQLGATAVGSRELVRRLRAAGLRRPPRPASGKHEGGAEAPPSRRLLRSAGAQRHFPRAGGGPAPQVTESVADERA